MFKSFLFDKLYFYLHENLFENNSIKIKIIENSGSVVTKLNSNTDMKQLICIFPDGPYGNQYQEIK